MYLLDLLNVNTFSNLYNFAGRGGGVYGRVEHNLLRGGQPAEVSKRLRGFLKLHETSFLLDLIDLCVVDLPHWQTQDE